MTGIPFSPATMDAAMGVDRRIKILNHSLKLAFDNIVSIIDQYNTVMGATHVHISWE